MSARFWSLLLLALVPLALAVPQAARADQQQYVVVYVEFQPDLRAHGAKLLGQLAALGSASPGVVSFSANSQINRANFYVLVEIWQNATAYQNFITSSAATALISQIEPFLEAPFDERDGVLIE
jgi:quinol monooxygenase YgiN